MNTFIVSDIADSPVFSEELSVAAVAGHPYLTHVAPLVIFNPTGSGETIRLRKIRLHEVIAQTTTSTIAYETYRITAHTVSDDVVTASKFDSNNATLPSQVVFCRNPVSVTVSGAAIDTMPQAFQFAPSRAIGGFWKTPVYMNRFNGNDTTIAEKQRITLREGEGIAVSVPSNAVSTSWRWQAAVQVRVVATGALYHYVCPINNRGLPPFSLLNGSGSGVVLEVVAMIFSEIGTDDQMRFTIEPIDGIDTSSGTQLTPIAMDSSSSLAGTVVYRNAGYMMRGAKAGALISIPQMQWIAPYRYGIGAGFANTFTNFHNFESDYVQELDMVLREGEGVAIARKNASAVGQVRMSITLTSSSPVYPVENDVRDGEVYGPNANDYTGTLVVGGGGSGYSRGRVVNA
jgi:hypothetical protein